MLIDHLGDDEVLKEVRAPVLLALRGNRGAFGRSVHVERLPAPGRRDAPPRCLREDLRGSEYHAWRNTEAARKLLFCE